MGISDCYFRHTYRVPTKHIRQFFPLYGRLVMHLIEMDSRTAMSKAETAANAARPRWWKNPYIVGVNLPCHGENRVPNKNRVRFKFWSLSFASSKWKKSYLFGGCTHLRFRSLLFLLIRCSDGQICSLIDWQACLCNGWYTEMFGVWNDFYGFLPEADLGLASFLFEREQHYLGFTYVHFHSQFAVKLL